MRRFSSSVRVRVYALQRPRRNACYEDRREPGRDRHRTDQADATDERRDDRLRDVLRAESVG